MFTIHYGKGRTMKVLTIGNVTTETRAEILAYAYGVAGETAQSLFGQKVETVGSISSVTLYTD